LSVGDAEQAVGLQPAADTRLHWIL
jgi:hypothetical protein